MQQLLEIFGAGTACIVSPVYYIDFMGQALHIPTLNNSEPIYKIMQKRLSDVQYGVISEHPWTLLVE